ncbi:hypothetical protein B0E42_20300 [Pseudomonas sp. A25(2017)]|uniref:hypothetical protein n=1 Tax=Pseudomonas sp. A25(2017) TaxID=1945865 RepID=UPI00098687FF|nr:hypothetical protein [Pseudomonas sp. A25(2017)]OOG83183.1 hypothetical protein B0E42_20300 [Pseudomonas sp. A25(2017)]
MTNKKFAVVVLGALVVGLVIQVKQFAMINSGLTIIAANQVMSEANQALGNATLSMIHATAEKTLAVQQAADAGREVRP